MQFMNKILRFIKNEWLKKFIQMNKSNPSNRYHEKSESDASAFS